MDSYQIDSHKLIYHPKRIADWLEGKDIYPIYVEIALYGGCNHRCIFCALDYLDYKPQFIDKDILIDILSEMAQCGVKSVMYAGEGEPLLHKDITELILHTKKIGIDVAVTTNGVFFNNEIAKKTLSVLTWLRISLDAGTALTYSKIHCCNPDDFQRVFDNISCAVKLKRENNYACTIGVQFILLPDNYKEVLVLAKQLRDRGVDYLIIKPYSHHPLSKNKINETFNYSNYLYLDEELQKLSDSNFKIIFRAHTMRKVKQKKPYKRCLGLPFWTYIDSTGNIFACSSFLGNEKFSYGNIYKNTFKEIWEGEKRKQILDMFAREFDASQCRKACRLDEINRYLWELKYPPEHVNFI